MAIRTLIRFAIALIAIAVAIPGSALAQQTDVIRGRVTGPDNRPIEGVQVTATSVSGGVNRTARTNNDGRFTGLRFQSILDGGAYGSYGVASPYYTGALQCTTYQFPT